MQLSTIRHDVTKVLKHDMIHLTKETESKIIYILEVVIGNEFFFPLEW